VREWEDEFMLGMIELVVVDDVDESDVVK